VGVHLAVSVVNGIVEAGRHLFVTSGVGTSIIPVRFRVPPEVSVLDIIRAVSPGGRL
jgi:hypothetical protein